MKRLFTTTAGPGDWRFALILADTIGLITLLAFLCGCALPSEVQPETWRAQMFQPPPPPPKDPALGVPRGVFVHQSEAWNKSQFETIKQYAERMAAITNPVCVGGSLDLFLHRYDAETRKLFILGSMGVSKMEFFPPPILNSTVDPATAQRLIEKKEGWLLMHLLPSGRADQAGRPILVPNKLELLNSKTKEIIATVEPLKASKPSGDRT